jgi:hypothetical protein
VNFGTVLSVVRGRILRGFYEGGGAFLDSAKEELRGGLTVETFRGETSHLRFRKYPSGNELALRF